MNILLDHLPTSINAGEKEFEICSDFRTSIRFEILMGNPVLSDEEKVMQGLSLYYPGVLPSDIQLAVDQMIWFYKGGKEEEEIKQSGRGGKAPARIYSFEHDDAYIYAAFLSQYRVDLNDIEYLHWWKFKALFQALSEDNEIVKIMGYRSISIDSRMSKEQKNFYRRMKERYKLPMHKDEKEKINAIEEALLHNQDVRELL